jgi:hypothetical protein
MGICELAERNMEASMSNNLREYARLRSNMRILPDKGDYCLNDGEMNPEILRAFALKVKEVLSPSPLWEPFSGNMGSGSRTKLVMAQYGLSVLCYGLDHADSDIEIVDSTTHSPRVGNIGGAIFHPPYFGSRWFTNRAEDLSCIENYDTYQEKLASVVCRIRNATVSGMLVCAVGRRYRYLGEEISLDLMYLSLFEGGFVLEDVWSSIPDIVLIFRRQE